MRTDTSIPWAGWATPGDGPQYRFTARRRHRLIGWLRHRPGRHHLRRKGVA